MSNAVEDIATTSFLEALVMGVEDDASRQDIEYMIDELFPVLIPGIVHLLKAHGEQQRRRREEGEEEGDDDVAPLAIQPLDHLARYLMRHNPRHNEPTVEATEIKALARKLLRK